MFAINGPAWTELARRVDFVVGETVASYETVTIWSDEDRASYGIKTVVDDPIPEGKIATGSHLIDDDGTPRRVWTLEDAPPPPAPEVISDRQFAYALAIKGRLTFDEAEEWSAVGALPQIVLDALEHVPEENHQRVIVRGKLRAAKEYHRNDPATVLMAELMGETPEFMDEVWRIGAEL